MAEQLKMTGIKKIFPGVVALDDVDFRLLPGEIHALMGENGAGKSTLIKVLTGVYDIDGGEIELAGERVRFTGPLQAQQAGISTVYQEVNLCPNLSVAENIFIGREPRKFGRIQWSETRKRAQASLARLDLDIDVTAQLDSYSLAIQQMVAIARATDVGTTKVLILDEPTSSLDASEVEQLFTIMRRLKADGVAILFVSHFLDQVYEIADRMTVLRNGRLIGEYRTDELPQMQLVSKMIGKELEALEQIEEHAKDTTAVERGTPIVEARELGRDGAIAPFSLTIHAGEVVGLAGLLGSGRTELARLLFGADRPDRGELLIDGKPHTVKAPRDAMAEGIAFSSENRRTEGIIGELTVRENMILAMQAARGWTRPIPRRKQDELVEQYIKALQIRPADPERLVRDLSGGNQQKVLLARWLITEPRLLIIDEPTRGIDVGAKAEIQRLVAQLADGGMAVLFVSAELEEVLRLSHKIEVLRDRRLVEELENGADVDADRIMQTIASGATT
ncbi:sugar ABC transporter ATP-binding protein [Actinoplanes sp. TRM 88003]|uniref:Sugar ABC transporter ATP-binding protein n=1 Tax=Paractinoplanes aksuensis TaxID=2939490 RepID=A0ABT1DHB1_9ACTN|nr:sugar ABC transporter ATP-binding protein [Actinoplanes aksuensis]MCO8270195.1 sugar ABC transporter ATP-binding protein [Actinoplanes aksuensis]